MPFRQRDELSHLAISGLSIMRSKGILHILAGPLTAIGLSALLLLGAEAPTRAHDITLATRMATSTRPWLGDQDRQGLKARGPIRVGVVFPDYPPLSILYADRYQGVTADYLALIFDGAPEFHVFPSRSSAIEALRNGTIDLLGTGSDVEARDNGLLLSDSYLPDRPVLVTSDATTFDPQRPGTVLGMTAGYLPEPAVREAYPHSSIQLYDSPQRALEALTLGEIDAVLGDAVSSHYLIQTHYLLSLRIENFAPIDSHGFRFLLRVGDEPLRAIINRALPKISGRYGEDILRSWSAGRRLLFEDERVALTPAEQRWLDTHPQVSVAANYSLGALGELDSNHHVTGIGRDYLELISQRSGLKFTYLGGKNFLETKKLLTESGALLTPVMPATDQLDSGLDILPPYLRSSVVLMTVADGTRSSKQHITSLADLKGKRLATAEGYFLVDRIRREYPDIQLKLYPTFLEALQSVEGGQNDAFLSSDFTGRYLAAQYFENRVQVTGILQNLPVPIALGVVKNQPELRSILEKAQLAIPPDDIAKVAHAWEPRFAKGRSDFWRDHQANILRMSGIFAALIAISLIWAFYLQRQIRRTRAAEAKAEAANQAKSIFLSTMSHEMRTPLNVVIGLQELVQRKAQQGVVDTASLAVAQEAAQGLQLLLGNVLDLSRIESGQVDSAREAVSLKVQIQGAISLVSAMAQRNGLTLDVDLQDDIDEWVLMDPLHFKQVLLNLLGNAIKFTERGGVTLQARATRQADQLHLLLDVIDTGIGISDADKARLFAPFSQVGNRAVGHARGSGLGLHISRRLVHLMGGTIDLDSTPSQGSRFTIDLTLPICQAPSVIQGPHATSQLQPSPPRKLSILVAEDHPLNRLTLGMQLETLGHEAKMAEDGQEAWELWLGQHFDIVISDGMMPRMSGEELARKIRREERTSSRQPCRIVGLTAAAEADAMDRYLAAGMDHVLFKPVKLDELAKALGDGTPD